MVGFSGGLLLLFDDSFSCLGLFLSLSFFLLGFSSWGLFLLSVFLRGGRFLFLSFNFLIGLLRGLFLDLFLSNGLGNLLAVMGRCGVNAMLARLSVTNLRVMSVSVLLFLFDGSGSDLISTSVCGLLDSLLNVFCGGSFGRRCTSLGRGLSGSLLDLGLHSGRSRGLPDC